MGSLPVLGVSRVESPTGSTHSEQNKAGVFAVAHNGRPSQA